MLLTICFSANEEKAVVLKNDFDYSSQEYECFIEFDQDWNVTKIRYNHTEKVTVPRDLFEGEKGLIYFAIKGVQEGEEKPISSIGLYYRVNGNMDRMDKRANYLLRQMFNKPKSYKNEREKGVLTNHLSSSIL